MAERTTVTTEASQRSIISGRWLVAPFGILVSGVLAAFVLGILYDGSGPMPWFAAVAAIAVVVLGGILTGIGIGTRVSGRVMAAASLLPMPTVAIAWILMVGLSQSASDAAFSGPLALLLLALWEGPMLGTLAVLWSQQRRASERMAMGPPDPPPMERELRSATHDGRADAVVRIYLDDPGGQAHLEADRATLALHGYDVASITRKPGWPGFLRFAASMLLLLSIGGDDPYLGAARVVATFRLRPHT